MATVLKIVFGKDIRRCSISNPAELTWPVVQRRVAELLGVDVAPLHVAYKDDEGDLVTIASTEELAEALRLAALATPPILRLIVSKKPGAQPLSPSPPPTAASGLATPTQTPAPAPPNVHEILTLVAMELPVLRPIINRLKNGIRLARGELAPAGGPAPAAATAAAAAAAAAGGSALPFGVAAPAPHENLGATPRHDATPAAQPFAGIHPMHTCDVCDVSPIRGVRYHSKVLPNYDLCDTCFAAEGAKAGAHKPAFDESFTPMRGQPFGPSGGGFGSGVGPWRRGCRGGGGGAGGGFAHAERAAEWAERARPGARFIRDVTVFDGTEVGPGAKFTKIWRLRNEGEAPWPAGTRLAFCGGDQMGALPLALVGTADGVVAPGAEQDIAVDMVAPHTLGRYVGYWRLCTPRGKRFGQRIWASVTVVDPASPPAFNAADVEGAPADHGATDDQDAAEDDGGAQQGAAGGAVDEARSIARMLSDIMREAKGAVEESAGSVNSFADAFDQAARAFERGSPSGGGWATGEQPAEPAAHTAAAAAAAAPAAADVQLKPKEPAADAAAVAPPAEPKTSPPRATTPTPVRWPADAAPPPATAPPAPAPAPTSADPLASLSLSTLAFPVEVADGRRLTISWSSGADARAVAEAFAAEHRLPAEDKEDIVAFVHTAEALVARQRASRQAQRNAAETKPAVASPAPPIAAATVAEPAVAAAGAQPQPLALSAAPSLESAAASVGAPAATAGAAASASEDASARAVATLRSMGFTQDNALLATVAANNDNEIGACVNDLSALADWDTLLNDLEAMGFDDAGRNRTALVKNRGDVRAAVRDLVKGNGSVQGAVGASV